MAAPAIKERDGCFTVRVRGSRYPSNKGIERWKLYSLFAPGDTLRLAPAPDNPEDGFAIAVWVLIQSARTCFSAMYRLTSEPPSHSRN